MVALRTKRRVVSGFLLAQLIWPMIQIVLVMYADAHPWKFQGWAMYAALIRERRLVVQGSLPGGGPMSIYFLPPRAQAARNAFLHRRNYYGRFERPDQLHRVLVADGWRVDAIDVVWTGWDRMRGVWTSIGPGSGEWTYYRQRYDYGN